MTKQQIEAMQWCISRLSIEIWDDHSSIEIAQEAINELENKVGKETRIKEIWIVEWVANKMFEIFLDFLHTNNINVLEWSMTEFADFMDTKWVFNFQKHLQSYITTSRFAGVNNQDSDTENNKRNK